MNDTPTKRKNRKPGRPRTSSYKPLNTGVRELYNQLVEFARVCDGKGMLAAAEKWIETLSARAAKDGPVGDDYNAYAETVLMVRLDNDPAFSKEDVMLELYLRRAESPRRDARAYAKILVALLDERRTKGLPVDSTLQDRAALALKNAKGKGRGKDPDVTWNPARNNGLLLAYESGMTATELLTRDGMARAIRTFVPDSANRPIGDSDLFTREQAIYKLLERERRERDIVDQCLNDLLLLSPYLPWMIPPGVRSP